MSEQPETSMTPAREKPKRGSVIRRVFTIAVVSVFACILLVVGGYIVVFRGVIGAPADLHTSEEVTTEFVAALAARDAEAAYSMMADPAKAQTSLDDVRALADQVALSGYSALRMCEFQLIFGQYGKQLVGVGLVRHNQELTVVQSVLVQNAGWDWKVLSFRFLPDVETKLWGSCQYDPP